MSYKEGSKNPVITELQLKEDLILVKSSQEVFGRHSKFSKKKKSGSDQLQKSDEFSRSSPVLPYCSLEKGAGKELTALIDRTIPGESFKTKFGSDMADTYSVQKELSNRMKELERSKYILQSSIKPLDHLRTALRMPNILRTFHRIDKICRRERLSKSLNNWKLFTSSHRDYAMLLGDRKRHAVGVLQQFWRASRARRELYARRKTKKLQDHRRSSCAVLKIENKFIKYKAAKQNRKIASDIMQEKACRCAIRIQSAFRGWIARSLRVDCLRILLLKDLRAWAEGNIQKLFDRPGLQDAKTTHMLLQSVALTSIPPRPMRLLPKITTVISCRKWVAIRRHEEDIKAAALREEYRNMLRERKDMARNDREDEFRRHFGEVLKQLEKQKRVAQAIVDKREAAAALERELRKSTQNIVESIKLEEVLERREREEMFRCEYKQRAVENKIRAIAQRKHNTEWILMDCEDAASQKLHRMEEDETCKQEKLYNELLRVRLARKQEVVFDAASIVKGGKIDRSVLKTRVEGDDNLSLVDHRDPTGIKLRTEDCFEIANLVKLGFDGPNGCGRCEVCDCNVDWKTSPKIMHMCTLALERAVMNASALFDTPMQLRCNMSKVLHNEKNKVATGAIVGELEARIVPDDDCYAKYILLLNLRDARSSREECIRKIWILQDQLKSDHMELMNTRKRLRTEKFGTRSERQNVQEESIYLENKAINTGNILASTCNRVYEESHREIKLFCTLFHSGFVPTHKDASIGTEIPSPLSMKLCEEDENIIRSVKQLKSVYYENGACEYIDKPTSLQASIDKLPTWPQHYIDALVSEQRLIIKRKEEVKVEQSHYMSHRDYHNLKKYKKNEPNPKVLGKTQKKVDLATDPVVVPLIVKDKSKSSRNIPGLSKFALDNIKEASIYIEAEATKAWSSSLTEWFNRMEKQWKADKRTLILSYLQRVRHILYGGSRYSTLKNNDTRLAITVDDESAFDLMEFLLCRGGLAIKPTNIYDTHIAEETVFPSEMLDAVFGKHPFSIAVYLYLTREVIYLRLFTTTLTTIKGQRYRHGIIKSEDVPDQSSSPSPLSAILKNNIFALTRLLKLPHELQHDSLKLRKYSSTAIEWDRYINPRWPLSYDQYHYLKYHHLYTIEVYGAVMMGITTEFQDCQSLFSTIASGALITFAEIVPQSPKKKKGAIKPIQQEKPSRPASKSSSTRNLSATDVMSTSELDFTSPSDTTNGNTENLKPIGRIELADVVHLGRVLQAYRSNMGGKPVVTSQYWVSVPSWMLPAYYWGRRARPNFAKRMSSIQDSSDPLLEAFENKVTDCALSVTGLLARKANKRLERERREVDTKMMAMNNSLMAFEDALSQAVEKFDKNRKREEMEAKNWASQNSAWYKRLYNWTFGKKKVTFYPEGFSPEDMNASAKKVVALRARLPNAVSTESMMSLFQKPIVLSSVELHDDYMTQLSLKDRYAKKKAVKRPDHINWIQITSDEAGQVGGTTRKYVIPKKFTQWLGEMFVGGGVRSVICIARTVMDFENNPNGTSITEPMMLLESFGDDERIRYVRSCRVAFQDRLLCDASRSGFAVSVSDKSRNLSEFGYKVLRTESPRSEIDSVDIRHKVIWQIFTQNRYDNGVVYDILSRLQSLIRMYKAKKVVIKLREQKNFQRKQK